MILLVQLPRSKPQKKQNYFLMKGNYLQNMFIYNKIYYILQYINKLTALVP